MSNRFGKNNAITVGVSNTGGNETMISGNVTVSNKLIVGDKDTTGTSKFYNKITCVQAGQDTAGQPQLVLQNFDSGNSASSELSSLVFMTAKSDTENEWTATDSDAALGRLAWYGAGGDDKRWAGQLSLKQNGTYDTNDIPSEIRLSSQSRLTDGNGAAASNLSWGGPPDAAKEDANLSSLIVGGSAASLTHACATQVVIKNGVPPSAHLDDHIFIGSKNSAGSGTDTKATLSLVTEEDVDATALDAVGTLTTRIPIWVNGTCFWLYLDPV